MSAQAHDIRGSRSGPQHGRLVTGRRTAGLCNCLAPPRRAGERQVVMNAVQDRYRPPQLRASDADRDAVVAALSEHFQAGRLTTEELEERTGQGLAARTGGQLDGLTGDLPAPRPAAPPAPVAPRRRPGYLVLVPLVVPVAPRPVVAAG